MTIRIAKFTHIFRKVIRAQFYKNLILKRDFLLMLLYPNTLYSWDVRF